ncbi:MAG: N-acetylglucosamine kinase [Candidatus Cyclobacteriaceae bacterium M2_1C_046]
MILIADSGSSKTNWRLISTEGEILQAQSAGYNPYHQPAEFLIHELRDVLLPQLGKSKVDQVFYYGAGCSTKENIEKVKFAIEAAFMNAVVEIDHDLLAAARALCGDKPGIACILGTGANSCYYNGTAIEANAPSLGYILGDEGSGAYLGKLLLVRFTRNELPPLIMERLNKRYELSREIILAHVYQGNAPARYLASFSKFIFQNLKDPEIFKMVYDAFEQFFEKNIMMYEGYKDLPVHFTGSVAFYYGNILRQVAADKQINVRNITEGPIAGLALYHQNSLKK